MSYELLGRTKIEQSEERENMTKTGQEQEEGRYLRAGLPPWLSGITASYHLRKPPGGCDSAGSRICSPGLS